MNIPEPTTNFEQDPPVEMDADLFESIRHFFHLSTDMFALSDFQGYFELVNPAWRRTLGYSPEELAARPFIDFVHPSDVARTRELMERIVRLGSSTRAGIEEGTFENRYRCKDGTYKWLSWSCVADPGVNRIFAVARDVTRAKVAEEEVGRTLERMRASNDALRNFASVASHDLREPLRMITRFLQLLRDEYPENLDKQAEHYIRHAVEGAERLGGMIEDLLEYSSLERESRVFDAVDLGEVFARILEFLAVSIDEKQADVRIDWKAAPRVRGDVGLLVRLFQNLLANALKFNPPGKRPEVRVGFEDGAAGEEDKVVVRVRDNGVGIDPEQQELLFRLFQRLHPRDEFEGSGIGLAVAWKIVDQHGGRIWVESARGRGSTFSVALPRENSKTGCAE